LLDRQLVQARRGMAGYGWIGTAYFGWMLGLTLFTEIMTPVVQAVAALCTVEGLAFGAAVGVGFGLARSVDPWRGALSRAGSDPALVVDRYVSSSRRVVFRLGGVAISAALTYIDIALTLRL
jgi:hypothetical protein